MKKEKIKNSAELFFYKAEVDFNAANFLYKAYINDELEIDIEKIFFELQQAVEKLLKSYLCKHKIEFPKTHDIEQLINICKNNNLKLLKDIEKLIDLSDYAVSGRYDVIFQQDEENIEEYLKITEMLFSFIRNEIKR